MSKIITDKTGTFAQYITNGKYQTGYKSLQILSK